MTAKHEFDWKPIATAPADRQVALGKYSHNFTNGYHWSMSEGVVRHSRSFLWFKYTQDSYCAEYYSHWDELPPPPKTIAQ